MRFYERATVKKNDKQRKTSMKTYEQQEEKDGIKRQVVDKIVSLKVFFFFQKRVLGSTSPYGGMIFHIRMNMDFVKSKQVDVYNVGRSIER